MRKRMLSLCMALALCLTLLPTAVFASEDDTTQAVNAAAVAEVTADGQTTQYDSLAEAITDASDGSTVKLLADVETAEGITIEGKSLTLDLNKKTWTKTGMLLKIGSDTNVTVKNGTMDFTVEVGSDSSLNDREAYAIVLPSGAGSLTLENVNINVTDGPTSQGSTVPGYAISVAGGSLTIRGNGSYGRLYASSSNNAEVKLYGGSYTGIDLNGEATCADLLDKGYIFVDANNGYVNGTNTKTVEDISVIVCTHVDEEMKDGYYSRCGAECEHTYDENSGKCTTCNQPLAVQIIDADGTSTKYYIYAPDAIENAASGSTVKLLKMVGAALTISTPMKLYGNGHKITQLTVSGNVTLESLLPEGYAFQYPDTNKWINDSKLSSETSLHDVTTAEAPFSGVTFVPAESKTTVTFGQSVKLTFNIQFPTATTWIEFEWHGPDSTGNTNRIEPMRSPYTFEPTPKSAGKHTYHLTFSKDGYSENCDVEVTVEKAPPDLGTVSVESPGTIYDTTALDKITLIKTAGPEGTLTLDAGQTLKVGTKDYNWTFTPTDNKNYTTAADTVSLTVTEDTLDHIACTGTLKKTEYYYGESFDPAGLTVTAYYASGATRELKQDEYTFNSGLTVGQTGVTLTYQKMDCSVPGKITVKKAAWTGSIPEQKISCRNDLTGEQTASFPVNSLPSDSGRTEYALGIYTDTAQILKADSVCVDSDSGKLTYALSGTAKAGSAVTIPVTVTMNNYEDITVSFVITITESKDAAVTITGLPETVTYGDEFTLGATQTGDTGSAQDPWSWDFDENYFRRISDGIGNGKRTLTLRAIKAGAPAKSITMTYESATHKGSATVQIAAISKATPTGAPKYTAISGSGKKLSDAALTTEGGTFSVPGTVAWEQPDTTEVTANTAYKWVFTPVDTDNYDTLEGTVTLWHRSSSGGGSSGGTSTKTETTTNPDGSTTKTETKSDGTVTETTTNKDGSTTKTETKPDGSSKTEVKDTNGSTGTVNTGKDGQTTAEAKISDKAISDAKKSDEAVKVPAEVKAGEDIASAPTVKIDLPKNSGETKVEIPVKDVTPGMVAVIVKADGTEEIVKDSIPTEDGIRLTVDGDVTVKIVDNAKDFTDIGDHWAEDSIDFVSARGLVNGTSSTTFSPDAATTRAQLWTILARQAGADLTGGANWYEKAQAWAKANGISDGFNPDGTITRAQMVTMLYRAAGSPEAESISTFTDVSADSYYAKAVAWAVKNGITTGVGGGRFDPNGICTRAQIAAFLHRSYLSK